MIHYIICDMLGSAKDSEAVRALRQEPAAKGGKTTHIRAQIGGKWGENRRQNAAERLVGHSIRSFVKISTSLEASGRSDNALARLSLMVTV